MAQFQVYHTEGGITYWYEVRPNDPNPWNSAPTRAMTLRAPATVEANCFYDALVRLWPHVFAQELPPPFFHCDRNDERNSETKRIYSWDGVTMTVEKVSD